MQSTDRARAPLARSRRRPSALVLRLAFGFCYWVDKPLDARRARVPRPRAQPRVGPGLRLRRCPRERDGAAVRPRAGLSALSGRARRRTAGAGRDTGAGEDRAVARRRADGLADRPHRAARRGPARRCLGGVDRRGVSTARVASGVRVQRDALQRRRARRRVRASARRRSIGYAGRRRRRRHRAGAAWLARSPALAALDPAGDAALPAACGRLASISAAVSAWQSQCSPRRSRSSRRGRCATCASTIGSCSSPPKAA